jgi:hypothetical protein
MENNVRIEGLWIVTFARARGDITTGTAVFNDGLMLGGDSERCYIGDYVHTEHGIDGKVDLPLHTPRKNLSPFFGKTEEPKISFSLKRESKGPFAYIGDGEIQDPIDVSAHFTIALQLAYRLG